MIHWIHAYFFAALAGAVAVLLLTPLAQRIAVRFNVMDRPMGERHKRHGHATPLLGGMAMLTGWLLVLLASYLSRDDLGQMKYGTFLEQYLPGAQAVSTRLAWVIGGAVLATFLGLIDDIRSLKAHWKFLGQLIVALIAVGPGHMRASLFVEAPWFGYAVSILWFMTVMNAVNFFDNMDGLAAGTATIALGLFCAAAGLQHQYFVATFSALCAGCALGFWFYNYSPASIFMGDSGSHLLGYWLAAVSIGTTYYNPGISASRFSILVPLCILAIPLFDAVAVTIIRARNGKPFWIGDHNHISHRFVKMGLSRKQAVQLVHLLCLLTGLSVLPVLWASPRTVTVIFVQMVLILLLVSILQYSVKAPGAGEVVPPDAEPKKTDEKP